MCASCNTNEPQNRLIGTWSQPERIEGNIKSITFNEKGVASYQDIPDPSRDILPGWSGFFASLNYSVANGKIYFSGQSTVNIPDTIPFEYSTDFFIYGNTLIIDSFSYDGGVSTRFYKPLILYKQ